MPRPKTVTDYRTHVVHVRLNDEEKRTIEAYMQANEIPSIAPMFREALIELIALDEKARKRLITEQAKEHPLNVNKILYYTRRAIGRFRAKAGSKVTRRVSKDYYERVRAGKETPMPLEVLAGEA